MSQLVSNKTSSARLYSLLTAAIAGAGAAYMFLPDTSLSVSAPAPVLGDVWGAAAGAQSSWSVGACSLSSADPVFCFAAMFTITICCVCMLHLSSHRLLQGE
jgi:hypothetical protein